VQPERADLSPTDVRRRFAAAPEPDLDVLVGRHRAELVGPGWWREQLAPRVLALAAMPGWWGKAFARTGDPGVLDGHNLLLRQGGLEPSFPMRARVAPSRRDGRAAVVVTYPPPAPWPWRQVTDELRPGEEGVLLGLMFTSVPTIPGGLPFLLYRDAEA
jgi:hypothetical protein